MKSNDVSNIYDNFFTGDVQRKFPRNRYPKAMRQAKKAANKAGLNAIARLSGTEN